MVQRRERDKDKKGDRNIVRVTGFGVFIILPPAEGTLHLTAGRNFRETHELEEALHDARSCLSGF